MHTQPLARPVTHGGSRNVPSERRIVRHNRTTATLAFTVTPVQIDRCTAGYTSLQTGQPDETPGVSNVRNFKTQYQEINHEAT